MAEHRVEMMVDAVGELVQLLLESLSVLCKKVTIQFYFGNQQQVTVAFKEAENNLPNTKKVYFASPEKT